MVTIGYSDSMTFETILEELLSAVPNTVDKREGSIIYDALSPAAAMLAQCYRELDMVLDESFADTCSLEYLIKRCKERGVPIQGATPAVIEGIFTPITVKIPDGSRFNCNDLNYVVTEQLGDGRYKLECESAGRTGNQYSGFLLPIQYISGLQTAEIAGVLIPGEDGDDTETLRERYFDSLSSLAYGGNIADYKSKVKLLPGVGGVKVQRAPFGGGTVLVTITDSDYNVPTSLLLDAVQTELDPVQNHGEGVGIAPIGHTVTVQGVTPFPVTVETNLTFVTGYDYDTSRGTLEQAVKQYFSNLSAQWEDELTLVVRISQIENQLLNLSCVLDISDTTLNGSPKNIELDRNAIPVLERLAVVP